MPSVNLPNLQEAKISQFADDTTLINYFKTQLLISLMKYLQMKHFRKILIFGSYCDLYQKERNIAKDKVLAEILFQPEIKIALLIDRP